MAKKKKHKVEKGLKWAEVRAQSLLFDIRSILSFSQWDSLRQNISIALNEAYEAGRKEKGDG